MNTMMSKIFIRPAVGAALNLLAIGSLSLRPDPAAVSEVRGEPAVAFE